MKELIRDEDGVTLVELLAGLALLSLILIPLGSVLSISAKSVKIQREQAEIQSVANLMTAQMIDISQRKNIYRNIGYEDYGSSEWDKNHLLKIRNNGSETIDITDANDTGFNRKKSYRVPSPDVTIHVDQKKNKNDQRKTNQNLYNARDTFTIQETVTIYFEKRGKEVYRQEIELDFRDENKAQGKVGGDGWW